MIDAGGKIPVDSGWRQVPVWKTSRLIVWIHSKMSESKGLKVSVRHLNAQKTPHITGSENSDG